MTIICQAPPVVSVHLLTYNSEKFVREAINSVLQQGYESLQIVISDDASSDGTVAIIREFETNYPGIFLVNINPENLGITRNANVALSLCTGEFVAFHAGDDVMLPTKLQLQVSYFRDNPECVICYHNIDIFDSKSGKSLGLYNGLKHPPYQGSVSKVIKYGCFAGGCSVMVRRAAIPGNGFNDAFRTAGDWHFYIDILLKGGEIRYINKILSRYRRHDNNTTSTTSKINTQAVMDALNTSNWVMVNHPKYLMDALSSYAVHIRLLRRVDDNNYIYVISLLSSLKIDFKLSTAFALAIFFLTLGRKKL